MKSYDVVIIGSGLIGVATAKLTRAMLDGGAAPYDLSAFDPMRFSKEV